MTKNELIDKLQTVEGNPVILLSYTELGCTELKTIRLEKMHQSKDDKEKYVTDFEFECETGYNTFYHDNYKKNANECIVFSL